jgi:2-oxoisovalerate dehydrogenase E2 component (dihydrolipoyl transacylase)
MKIFYLPDLGEGLHEAEIREWFVKEGDHVTEDQPIVAMETAKALLDVPAPFTGTITKLHGNAGEIVKTGAPLVSFAADAQTSHEPDKHKNDAGTVVGNIEVGNKVIYESATGVKPAAATGTRIKASPAVRKLAISLVVDLNTVTATGPGGSITGVDVQAAAESAGGVYHAHKTADLSQVAIVESSGDLHSPAAGHYAGNTVASAMSQSSGSTQAPGADQFSSDSVSTPTIPTGYTALHGVTRSMAINMALAHQQIVPVTIVDDADINHFGPNEDISVRIMRAIQSACENIPKLNAHFHGKSLSLKTIKEINLAVAVDTEAGLYAPVIKDIANKKDTDLRATINDFKVHAKQQDFPPALLQGATITLSNFGVFVGRYASPIIVPPTVAIIGIGKIREAVVADKGEVAVHKILPISLTVDHRVITGGEAARFLAALINALQL